MAKAKEIVEKGHKGENFWLPESKGGYRYVESDEEDDPYDESLRDRTDKATEPTGEGGTVTLAEAQHCEGAKGNMILVAERVRWPIVLA